MSTLSSTGGGRGHKPGCTCPFCASKNRVESGVSLSGAPAEGMRPTFAARPQAAPAALTGAQKAWAQVEKVLNFGLTKPDPNATRAEKATLLSQGGALAGGAAMTGGAVLGAPALAAGAAGVLVVSSVVMLASVIINRGKK